jgi:hypothetical protein
MYRTTSLAECAFLLARGYKVLEVEQQAESHLKQFCFDKAAGGVVSEFYSNQPIPAHDFHPAMLAARRLIRE